MLQRVKDFFGEIWYFVRCHLWTRYHVINISGQDGYKWGWIDRDHAMWLACFTLLCDFIEKEVEDGYGTTETVRDYYPDWPDKPIHKDDLKFIKAQIGRHRAIREIYDWYKTGRAKEQAECHELFKKLPERKMVRRTDNLLEWLPDNSAAHKEWFDRHQELDQKNEKMLLKLIKMRGNLWT